MASEEAVSTNGDEHMDEKPSTYSITGEKQLASKAPLEPYMKQAYEDMQSHTAVTEGKEPESAPSQFFSRHGQGEASLEVMLHRGRVNRILLFTGAFNPPHSSHLDVLYDAFFRSGADLNAIAAIIHPWERIAPIDTYDGDEIHLSQTERSQLIMSADAPPGSPHHRSWAYVFTEGFWDLKRFLHGLKKRTKQDGFEVETVRVFGADHVTRSCPPRRAEFATSFYIVSEAGRDATFVDSDSKALRRLFGYASWHRIAASDLTIHHQLCRLHAAGYDPRPAGTATATAQNGTPDHNPHDSSRDSCLGAISRALRADLRRVRECTSHHGGIRVRFVPRSARRSRPLLSSTLLRFIMLERPLEDVACGLPGALSLALLVQMVSLRRAQGEEGKDEALAEAARGDSAMAGMELAEA